MKEADKLYFAETENSLQSKDKNIIKARLKELKKTGNATLLPLVLRLLSPKTDEDILQLTFGLLSELRDQDCAAVISKFIDDNSTNPLLSSLIASCWQSRLNYSTHLTSFTNSFITGDYQVALESFTVIEETLWRTESSIIQECIAILDHRKAEIDPVKEPLSAELVKILREGRSSNADEHPELYKDES